MRTPTRRCGAHRSVFLEHHFVNQLQYRPLMQEELFKDHQIIAPSRLVRVHCVWTTAPTIPSLEQQLNLPSLDVYET